MIEVKHIPGLEQNADILTKPLAKINDLTQITLRSELLSQIRGSVVVLRDRIHRELRNLINLTRVIKLG